jgi:hypothetical protein
MSATATSTPTRSGSYVFPDGSSLVRARLLAWTPWAVAGVNFKLLDVDRSFDKSTFLLNAPESASIPAFKQSGALEMFIEAGHLRFERGTLGQGDYVHLPGGSRNGPFELAPGTQVYAIAHGPMRIGDQFIDANWMIDAVADTPAGDHIRAVLMSS